MMKSMTAFARKQYQDELGLLTIELKSLNHRYLEMNFHLPESLRHLEPHLREALSSHFQRGKLDCYVNFQSSAAAPRRVRVNRQVLEQVQQALRQVSGQGSPLARVDPLALLRWPDLLEVEDKGSKEVQALLKDIFEEVAHELLQMRAREGKRLNLVLQQQLLLAKQGVHKIREVLPEAQKARKAALLAKFAEAQLTLDPSRLEQELVYFANRTDVTEELDRLEAHIAEFEQILTETAAVGRRLDFLLQEMNREANTLSSKSFSATTVRAALDLKLFFEQMREQVQNIE